MPPSAFLAFMATPANPGTEEENDIWADIPVIRFLQTHKYERGLSVKGRDRVYRRAKAYCWMADGVYKLLAGGSMVVVPRMADRETITLEAHRGMGHYGVVVLNSIGSNHTCKQCITTIFVITRWKTRVNDCVNDVLLELCNSVHKIVPK